MVPASRKLLGTTRSHLCGPTTTQHWPGGHERRPLPAPPTWRGPSAGGLLPRSASLHLRPVEASRRSREAGTDPRELAPPKPLLRLNLPEWVSANVSANDSVKSGAAPLPDPVASPPCAARRGALRPTPGVARPRNQSAKAERLRSKDRGRFCVGAKFRVPLSPNELSGSISQRMSPVTLCSSWRASGTGKVRRRSQKGPEAFAQQLRRRQNRAASASLDRAAMAIACSVSSSRSLDTSSLL